MDFATFFRHATRDADNPKGRAPYPYQERFAAASQLPHLLRAPTGAGKTATAILGWLWRRVSKKPGTPQRLVYCLPMRVLVEQSVREAAKWVAALLKEKVLPETENVPVHILMGGIETEKWHLNPEKPAVLIGTQDMLLSRALNRGYAASRFYWPIDFGLLNNDCLWVFDEPQLMGSGVSTSAQLAGLRAALGTFGPCPSVWMSATLEPGWLGTVDFRGKFGDKPLELDDDDYDPKRPLYKRMTAAKTLSVLGVSLGKEADDKEAKEVAAKIIAKHREAPGTQTLVVLNTVKRAKKVYEALLELRKKSKSDSAKLLLIHSRFRPHEREWRNDQLQQTGDVAADRIIVATQVVEAGVDISARTLITELAPWASIVQRIGRCNRTGDDGPGRVYWIDLNTEKQSAPYESFDLTFARERLAELDGKDVSPKALDDFKVKNRIVLPFEHRHVIRRRDLLDLFDTSPDLSGNDIDVSRFVRGDDPESDVRVFWRSLDGVSPRANLSAAHRRELCPVPVGSELRDFLAKLRDKKGLFGYVWDHLGEEWVRLDPRQVRPGQTILLPDTAGGYSELGWDADCSAAVEPVSPSPGAPEEGASNDPESSGPPLTIATHTGNVCAELDKILDGVKNLINGWEKHLTKAARWHDAGKAHRVFQASVRSANPKLPTDEQWAKSGVSKALRHERKYFRHELASALAALQHGLPFEVVYPIAAHHGKVRLSIRPLPNESLPDEECRSVAVREKRGEVLYALGVWDLDELPEVELGGGECCPKTRLDLSPMQLGGEGSWTARALKLLGELGPFRLAYLEALLRAADLRASANERKVKDHA
jgi:CRISPR-associated endonuclease/helicase Cas3